MARRDGRPDCREARAQNERALANPGRVPCIYSAIVGGPTPVPLSLLGRAGMRPPPRPCCRLVGENTNSEPCVAQPGSACFWLVFQFAFGLQNRGRRCKVRYAKRGSAQSLPRKPIRTPNCPSKLRKDRHRANDSGGRRDLHYLVQLDSIILAPHVIEPMPHIAA